jgi:hypothetical protein
MHSGSQAACRLAADTTLIGIRSTLLNAIGY